MAGCGVDTICVDTLKNMRTHIHREPCWREMAVESQTTGTRRSQVTHRIQSATPFLSDMRGSLSREWEWVSKIGVRSARRKLGGVTNFYIQYLRASQFGIRLKENQTSSNMADEVALNTTGRIGAQGQILPCEVGA